MCAHMCVCERERESQFCVHMRMERDTPQICVTTFVPAVSSLILCLKGEPIRHVKPRNRGLLPITRSRGKAAEGGGGGGGGGGRVAADARKQQQRGAGGRVHALLIEGQTNPLKSREGSRPSSTQSSPRLPRKNARHSPSSGDGGPVAQGGRAHVPARLAPLGLQPQQQPNQQLLQPEQQHRRVHDPYLHPTGSPGLGRRGGHGSPHLRRKSDWDLLKQQQQLQRQQNLGYAELHHQHQLEHQQQHHDPDGRAGARVPGQRSPVHRYLQEQLPPIQVDGPRRHSFDAVPGVASRSPGAPNTRFHFQNPGQNHLAPNGGRHNVGL